jgi:hypothetical protein
LCVPEIGAGKSLLSANKGGAKILSNPFDCTPTILAVAQTVCAGQSEIQRIQGFELPRNRKVLKLLGPINYRGIRQIF